MTFGLGFRDWQSWIRWYEKLIVGCVSQGETKEAALKNIQIAIREYLDAVPEVQDRFRTKVIHEEVAV